LRASQFLALWRALTLVCVRHSSMRQFQVYRPLSPEEEYHRNAYLCNSIEPKPGVTPVSLSLSLPFFHTCKGKDFRKIFTSKQLSTSDCPEFKEKLLYLFYGKPAYRVSSNGYTSRDIGRFPVCFIVNNQSLQGVKRVFPFDTGALIHSLLKDVCGDETNPAKYELGTDIDTVKKFVCFLYGSDKNYFNCTPRIKAEDVASFSFELQHILSLATESSDKQWDNRAYTIETQCCANIGLTKERISAIILPSSYMNSTEIVDFLFNEGIEAITYSTERTDPGHMSTHLMGLAQQYLEKKGVL
jgi:hypothetical protein